MAARPRPNSVEYDNSKTTTLLPSAKCTRPLFQGRTGCGGRPSGWHDIVTCQRLAVSCSPFLPVSFEAVARGFPWILGYESWYKKTRVPGLHNGENCDPTVITSVWRTGWRTGWLIAKSRCSIPAERDKKEVAMCMQCTVLWRWKCWFILRNITTIDGCLIIYRLAITFK